MTKLMARPMYPSKLFDGTLQYEQVALVATEGRYPDGLLWGFVHIDCFSDHARELYERLLVGVEIEIEIKEVNHES